MKIYKGTVIAASETKVYERPADAQFYVSIPNFKTPVVVTYTTPFYSLGYGGMLAIPDPGATVLVFESEDNLFYYLSTVVEKNSKNSQAQPQMIVDKKQTYPDKSTLARKVFYKNQFGAGLSMTHIYKKDKIIDTTIVESTKKKMLILSDSSKWDGIALQNEHFDGMAIHNKGGSVAEERSIVIAAKNSISCVSQEGAARFSVQNGAHIDIINYSSDITNLNVLNPMRDGGDVNVISQNRDVNISVRGTKSNVFITTKLARIRIDPLGTVTIQAPKINFKAAESISLDAPTININSELETKMYSNGLTNITSNLQTQIEGGAGVYLNSGSPGTPNPILPDTTLTDNLD